MRCPACPERLPGAEPGILSDHFLALDPVSDPAHIRWLNQNVSRDRLGSGELAKALDAVFRREGGSLSDWIISRFVSKFFGKTPHPFITALQRPSRATLLGYVYEHHHFLRQWVRSCGLILARAGDDAIIRYELENLNSEFGGFGTPGRSHYDLLLRMGESLGVSRSVVLSTPPLPTTMRCLDAWDRMASEGPWVEAMAAMHSLELIAHRGLTERGAALHYFEPEILSDGSITPEAVAFLKEGYEADVGHSEQALRLVERFSAGEDTTRAIQAACLYSFDLFDDYLMARLERADLLEGQL